jgi:hypothetical protein
MVIVFGVFFTPNEYRDIIWLVLSPTSLLANNKLSFMVGDNTNHIIRV